MYFNAKQLRHSEMTLLQSRCEVERTQLLTILIVAMQNIILAGRLHVNWEQVYVPCHRWKSRIVIPLSEDFVAF